MPIEYAGGGRAEGARGGPRGGRRLRRLPPRQGRGPRPGRAAFVNAASPTTSTGSAPGRRSTRCAATTRAAASSTTSSPTCADRTTSSSCRTPPTPPRSCGGSRRGAPDGVDGHRPARGLRRARRPGSAQRRAARAPRSADRARLHVVRATRSGRAVRSSSAGPATPASAATSCCRAGTTPVRCGTRCWRGEDSARGRAGSARATRCAPRWATRCTARTCRSTITPVQARAGWAVGWDKPAFWGRERAGAERAAGARRLLWGLLAPTGASRVAHMSGARS